MLTSLALAPSCLTETWVSTVNPTDSGIAIGNPYDTSCWPGARDIATTISPAICPVGYASACDGPSRRDASETVWACCPSGFHCDAGFFACLSNTLGDNSVTYTVTDLNILSSTTTKEWVATGGVNAHSIVVAFHSSDLAALFSSATPTSSAALISESSPASSDSGSLSTGSVALAYWFGRDTEAKGSKARAEPTLTSFIQGRTITQPVRATHKKEYIQHIAIRTYTSWTYDGL
ncbi:hypothetical protein M426DRAFT_14529 [Hypoxylon sp. CI-4A]|nr:hypothetical protein M426DRAFT_14529 [Hypoxylon sp. CI-4A]